MFRVPSSSAFFSREKTHSLRFCLQRDAAARFLSRKRCLRSSGSSSTVRRRRPPVGWAGDTWRRGGRGDGGKWKEQKKRLTTFLALEKWISHGQLLEVSTWGWAGDGASGCWTSSWFCSALWGTMGLLPVDMTPILWPDGLCWDRAAFSRCRTTIKQSHKCSKSAVAEKILKIKKS